MSVLSDVASIDSTRPSNVALVAGGKSLTVDTSGRIGIGTTTPRSRLDIAGSGATGLPTGSSGERPNPASDGMIRYNTDFQCVEGYASGNWWALTQYGRGIAEVIAEVDLGTIGASTWSIVWSAIYIVIRATISGVEVNSFDTFRLRWRTDGVWRGSRIAFDGVNPSDGGWRNKFIFDFGYYIVSEWESSATYPGAADITMFGSYGFGGNNDYWWIDANPECRRVTGWVLNSFRILEGFEISTTDGSNFNAGWVTLIGWRG